MLLPEGTQEVVSKTRAAAVHTHIHTHTYIVVEASFIASTIMKLPKKRLILST